MAAKVDKAPAQAAHHDAQRMDRKLYERELYRLQAELVKLRYFAGLTIEETAQVLGLSPATAKRHWIFARA